MTERQVPVPAPISPNWQAIDLVSEFYIDFKNLFSLKMFLEVCDIFPKIWLVDAVTKKSVSFVLPSIQKPLRTVGMRKSPREGRFPSISHGQY